jgi:hypothetical protein
MEVARVATFRLFTSPYDASHTFLVNLDLVRRAERVRHAGTSHVPDRTILFFSDKDDDVIEVVEPFEEIIGPTG